MAGRGASAGIAGVSGWAGAFTSVALLAGLGALGAFSAFLAGAGFRRLVLLTESLLLAGSGGLGLLGRASPALRGLFLLRRGFRLPLGGGPLRGLLLGHDFREVKDRHAGGFLLLGSVSGFVLRGGASCAGASALSGAGASETDCSCLRACTPLASGWAGAGSEPGPAASVTIFAFSSAIHISAFLFDGMKKGPDFLRSNPACRDTSFLCP